jgi:hypothetical protein
MEESVIEKSGEEKAGKKCKFLYIGCKNLFTPESIDWNVIGFAFHYAAFPKPM